MQGSRRWLTVAALAMAALAACSSGDDDVESAPATDSATTAASSTEAPTTTEAATTTSDAVTTTTELVTTTTAAPEPPTVAELLEREDVLNIAHAGGDREWPHSTPFAYAQADAVGADVMEADVLLTADGVLVVQHDDTVDKTTEATGPVLDRTLAELQALDNAYWFSPECWPCQDRPADEYLYRGVRTGEIPPPDGFAPEDFAVQTLERLSTDHADKVLDLEIKGAGQQGIAVAVALAAELERLDRVESTIVVSFDDEVLAAFRAAAPSVATSPGVGEMTPFVLSGAALDPSIKVIQIPPAFDGIQVLTPALVEQAHAAGIEVWVWPNSDEQESDAFYRELIAMGVDGIIAGRPSVLAAIG